MYVGGRRVCVYAKKRWGKLKGGGGGCILTSVSEEGDLRGWVNNGRDFSQERNVLKRVLPRRGNKVGRERWLLLPSIGFGGREIASLAAALGPLACLAAVLGPQAWGI